MINSEGGKIMTMHRYIRPRDKEIIFKVFDGEAILINLAKGICYSMEDVGGAIWKMIQEGHNLEEIIDEVLARYDASPEQVAADVEQLIGKLIEENLCSVSDDPSEPRNGCESQQQRKLPYNSPRLVIYRDMGHLLALDPPVPGLDNVAWNESDKKS